MSQDEIDGVGEGQKVQGDIITLERHESEDLKTDKNFSDMFSLNVENCLNSFTADNFSTFQEKVIGEGEKGASFKKDDIEKDISLIEAVASSLIVVMEKSAESNNEKVKSIFPKMKNVIAFIEKFKVKDRSEYWLLLRFYMDCISAELSETSLAGFGKRISVDHSELKGLELTVRALFNLLLDRGYIFTEPMYNAISKQRNVRP